MSDTIKDSRYLLQKAKDSENFAFSGILAQTFSATQAYSAKAPPVSDSPNTLSPTLN